ncbi:hypothetical protein SRHO_G00155020 [Serrasalmus rhombeus]
MSTRRPVEEEVDPTLLAFRRPSSCWRLISQMKVDCQALKLTRTALEKVINPQDWSFRINEKKTGRTNSLRKIRVVSHGNTR